MTEPKTRVEGLDTLRALAIVLVFAYHYAVFVSHSPTFGWIGVVGWTGVDLFFVLSGYLIGNGIFAGIAAGRRLSLRDFYLRRLLRTVPNYVVVLLLYFFLPTTLGAGALPPLWRFLTFTQNIGLSPGTLFSHAWSLCVEEQFYFVLPLSILLLLREGRATRWAGLLIPLLIAAGIAFRSAQWLRYGGAEGGRAYYTHIYYASLCRADEFLPGLALAWTKSRHPATWSAAASRGGTFLTLGAPGVGALFLLIVREKARMDQGHGFFMTGFGFSLLALAFAALTLAALSPSTVLHQIRVPGAASLAKWSYAIYLSHRAVANVVGERLASFDADPDSPLAVTLIASACLVAGWALYTFVEAPLMRLRDRHVPSSFETTSRTASRGSHQEPGS